MKGRVVTVVFLEELRDRCRKRKNRDELEWTGISPAYLNNLISSFVCPVAGGREQVGRSRKLCVGRRRRIRLRVSRARRYRLDRRGRFHSRLDAILVASVFRSSHGLAVRPRGVIPARQSRTSRDLGLRGRDRAQPSRGSMPFGARRQSLKGRPRPQPSLASIHSTYRPFPRYRSSGSLKRSTRG